MPSRKKNHYDVLIVGGGISGTALLYELAYQCQITLFT